MHAPDHSHHGHGHESHSHKKPNILARAVAPVARVLQKVQDKVAKVIGLKDMETASAVVGATGLTAMAVSSLLSGGAGLVTYGLGFLAAGAGGVGMIENHITKKLAKADGKGGTVATHH